MTFDVATNVRILTKNVIGEIIDVTVGVDGKTYYLVESDTEGYTSDPDALNGKWPIYTCAAEELELV